MRRLALIGRDIGYTRSPEVHGAIACVLGIELEFVVEDIESGALNETVARLYDSADGFFVTKPYKNDVKKYLASSTTVCGVNCVRSSDRAGFNTDGRGFIGSLDCSFGEKWRSDVSSALVLGAGGAAYSATEALIAQGKRVYVLNRTAKNALKMCVELGAEMYYNQQAEMIVNCTTLGLHGEDALCALCVLPKFTYAYDLIYSPPVTPFLTRSGEAGAKICNGADMLVMQAIEGDKILFDIDGDTTEIFRAVKKILSENNQ